MEQISAFMDGEVEDHEVAGQVKLLGDVPEFRAAWDTYHLIGDAMRGDAGLFSGFMAKVSARLAQEPTVLAPRPKVRLQRLPRLALSAAASIGGVALVAWLALSNNPFLPRENLAANQPSATPAQPAPLQMAAKPANGAVNDYLLAHQQFSPSTQMQGVASYVRTVSGREADMR